MKYKNIFFALALSLCSSSLLAISANEALNSTIDAHWQLRLQQDPVFASTTGVRDFDTQLADISLEANARYLDALRNIKTQLDDIDYASLSQKNQLNHDLLTLEIQNTLDENTFAASNMIFTNRYGPHLELTRMASILPFFNRADFRSYLARLQGIPAYLSQASERIQIALDSGWNQACEPMQGYEKSIASHIVDSPDKSVFLQPFSTRPSNISKADFTQLQQQARTIIAQSVIPAFKAFHQFYIDKVQATCKTKVGVSHLPDGEQYYQNRIRYYTTTDLSAKQIHQIGLDEVKRIRAEMHEIIKQAGFKGDFSAWLAHLRDTPEYYPKTAEERMQIASTISKKMDGELPKLFGRLPRMPYGLKPIPLDIAEKTTTAYYQPPAGDGSRAGIYYVNTSLLNTRPIYQLEALSLHEAVPGHHLQIALSQELDLPNFRKYGGQTVFIEGWALYSEKLGLEVGFYQTPYTNFGRLSYEMWRACRLVVDTGIHSLGWTRQQAIDYMVENSGLSLNNITSEVDRYITWPGQALAYKMGEIKISALRKKAEAHLEENFDIRAFHDTVLENGALPLSVLENIVEQWIKTQKISKQ